MMWGMDDYLTVIQAAAELDTTIQAIRWRIKRGKVNGGMKAEKVGRDWLISRSEIERWKSLPIKVGRPKEQPE